MVPPPRDRREELLAVARALTTRMPLHALTLADVAREAGVSWGVVRRHLGTRETLIAMLEPETAAAPLEPDTRRRLLEAAVRVFARAGYDRASMDQIAAEAGLTKGALYWHFPSKLELFKDIMAEQRARELRELPDMLHIFREAATLEDAWTRVLGDHLRDLRAHSDWVWLLFEFLTSSRDDEIRRLMLAGSTDINLRLREQITELKAQGYMPNDASVDYIAAYLAMFINGLAVVFLVKPDVSDHPDSLARHLAKLLLNGLRP